MSAPSTLLGAPEPGRDGVISCRPGRHPGVPTVVDERARRLSHEELFAAELIAREGHAVASLKERRGRGRQADLSVCGGPVEVKSFESLEERGGRAPSVEGVRNKLLAAEGQAPTVFVCGLGSGLTEEVARQGVESYALSSGRGGIRGVRVLGDGFDLSWSPRLLQQLRAGRDPGFDLGR